MLSPTDTYELILRASTDQTEWYFLDTGARRPLNVGVDATGGCNNTNGVE
jgi:hypothetical protein